MTNDAYDALMREIQRIGPNQVDAFDDDRARSVERIGTGPDADPSIHLERKEALEIISQSIEDLPERLRLVLWLYYYEHLTMKEVGSVLKVNEARACQLRSKAIASLKCAVSGRLQRQKPARRDTEQALAQTGAAR
jgi:RNA polymerase sigma factor for flagellar operon FliA